MKAFVVFSLVALTLYSASGCSDAKDLIELGLDPPGRESIDVSRMGVNNFFVNSEFGSISEQFRDINETLGLNYVRVLFAWTDDVQPTPSSPVSVDFFDRILAAIPPGVDVLIVVAHTPSWMGRSSNWIDGDPRRTWVEFWFRPLVERYANTPGIVGWEIWNEPDRTLFASDAALGLEDPANYFDLLTIASPVIRNTDPNALVVMAATESIQQNFPVKLNYNKQLRDLGAEDFIDVWNVHYYGTSFESVITNNGVGDFLNGLRVPIWITESGEQGPTQQLPYVETAWPFLRQEVPGIDRIYYFEYGSAAELSVNYGLRTTNAEFPVSDLYIYLRDQG